MSRNIDYLRQKVGVDIGHDDLLRSISDNAVIVTGNLTLTPAHEGTRLLVTAASVTITCNQNTKFPPGLGCEIIASGNTVTIAGSGVTVQVNPTKTLVLAANEGACLIGINDTTLLLVGGLVPV